jgi:arylsulfatase A-like enzyme
MPLNSYRNAPAPGAELMRLGYDHSGSEGAMVQPNRIFTIDAGAVLTRCLVATLVVAASFGCSRQTDLRPAAAATADRPSILVVVVDAMRADRLGCYGHDRPTTPEIDRVAADPDSVLFRRHYVQASWTKPSTASLFTGLYPFQHGVLDGHTPSEGGTSRQFTTQILDRQFNTVAESFKAAGFRTFGVVKSHHLVPEYGFAQGFDKYVSPKDLGGDRGRVDAALRLARKARGPFFAYLHLAGVHHPFRPRTRHPEIMAEYGFPYDEISRRQVGINFRNASIEQGIEDGEITLEPDDVRFLSVIYDAELRHVDERAIGPLINGLEEMALYDNLLLIISADHGEELYDHAGYAHGHALWDEVIRVPMIVKYPKGQKPEGMPREVDDVTQSIDLLPSLLAFFGERPPSELPGFDTLGGQSPGFAYSERREEWTLVTDPYKLIDGDDGPRLFNTSTDPTEHDDLADALPEVVTRLRAEAEALRQASAIGAHDAASIEVELDEESIEALRSLGYLR